MEADHLRLLFPGHPALEVPFSVQDGDQHIPEFDSQDSGATLTDDLEPLGAPREKGLLAIEGFTHWPRPRCLTLRLVWTLQRRIRMNVHQQPQHRRHHRTVKLQHADHMTRQEAEALLKASTNHHVTPSSHVTTD